MRRVFIGAALVIAGVAAFIEAGSHSPEYVGCSAYVAHKEGCPPGERGAVLSGHLAQTPYDLLRIGAWALVIVGALLVVLGLIGYWREGR